MQNLRRKLLSQNFLYNRDLVTKLIGRSSIGKKDLVIEIGPGKGIITEALVKQAGHVIAVELDLYWYRHLREIFLNCVNLTLYHDDFLQFSVPKLPYKVFANIPFAIEGKIIRKLIEAPNPPEDCYLVVISELAYRLSAENKENMFSAMHKPWFDFSIAYQFTAQDFSPKPSVNPVLFRFTQKKTPLLHWKERDRYRNFIQRAFGNGESIRKNLKSSIPITKIDTALQKLSINRKTRPTDLSLTQWISLYKELSA